MTERLTHVKSGSFDPSNALVESCYSNSATLPIWAPVKQVTAADAKGIVTVGTTTTEADVVYGVTVGDLMDAVNGYVATAIGQIVNVVKRGLAKLKVLGNGTNIAINDALISSTTAAKAVAAKSYSATGTYTTDSQKFGNAFAIALYASVADNDIIPVDVRGSRGNIS